MKYGWVIMVLVAAAVMPRAAKAQAEVYAEFSETKLTNLVTTNYLPGFTAGVLLDGPTFAKHITLSADIQGRFFNTSGQKLNGAAAGTLFTFALKHGLLPFGELMVGFGRYYSDGSKGDASGATTDSTLQFNGGLAKKITPRLDIVGEFSYEQFYALGGEYNPKTFSVGAIYHFVKR